MDEVAVTEGDPEEPLGRGMDRPETFEERPVGTVVTESFVRLGLSRTSCVQERLTGLGDCGDRSNRGHLGEHRRRWGADRRRRIAVGIAICLVRGLRTTVQSIVRLAIAKSTPESSAGALEAVQLARCTDGASQQGSSRHEVDREGGHSHGEGFS